MLTGATRIYDLVHERLLERPPGLPLEVPPRAVVVPGARAVNSAFGSSNGLSLYAPIIVKYRDEKADAATSLETALR